MKNNKVEVTIKKSGKLTLTEINALTEKILSDTGKIIVAHNNSYKESSSYKKELKSLKTKTGVLAAERAVLFLKDKHKKVEINVYSKEFNDQLSKLNSKYLKRNLSTWKGSHDYDSVRNKLILSQVKGNEMDEIYNEIVKSLVG